MAKDKQQSGVEVEFDEPKKKELPKPKIKPKEYFTVKIEVLTPATLTYRIYAESPEEAAQIAVKQNGQQMSAPPLISFGRIRNLKATVYAAGSSLVKYVKNLT